MPSTEPLTGASSVSVVRSGSFGSLTRISRRDRNSRKFIPAMVQRLTLDALGRFAGDVGCVIADCLITALSWLASEFLAGCAAYAEATYPRPSTERDSALNQMPEGVRPAPAPLRLVVIAGSLPDDGRQPPDRRLPSQAAAVVHTTPRDWAALQDLEAVRSPRAPAARRNNRPR